MKYKESSNPKYYLRNVYINQIMKPEIQNNLNYAYFENSEGIQNNNESESIEFNQDNFIFNSKSLNNFYKSYYPNEEKVKKNKKDLMAKRKFKNGRYNQNNFMGFNDENLFMNDINKKNNEIIVNDTSLPKKKLNNFFQTHSFFKKKLKNAKNISNLKENQLNIYNDALKKENKNNLENNDIYIFDNKKITYFNDETSPIKNKKSRSILKNGFVGKKSIYEDKNKNQNSKKGKNSIFNEKHKNDINQTNEINSINYKCSTAPNNKNNNYKFKNNSSGQKNLKYQNNFPENIQIKSYKNIEQDKNPFNKGFDRNSCKEPNNIKNLINNYNSPQRQIKDFQNIENISCINSPSIPSYSSIIDDNSINSKNYIWVKKNIKNNNNKMHNTLESYNLNNYYKKPNINQENIINQNLINFANNITNMNSYLFNPEVIFPSFLNQKIKKIEEIELFLHSAILIQSTFRRFLVKKKFDILYNNYKYYYHKGIEILKLILDYFFKKRINIINEKRKFFNYLTSLRRGKNVPFKNRRRPKNITVTKNPKIFKVSKFQNSTFSPVIEKGKVISKFYQDLYLHKEIGERFNIIGENHRDKDTEKRYKEKIDFINIKVNKLTKENNKLRDLNQKNIIMERKYRDISQENKKKDDIINIITNDNKTLAMKLKIIKDKFNKLQIQNQEDINYNSSEIQFNKNNSIDLFEEYRNLFLSFLIHKMNEKFYLSISRKYLYKWKNNIFSLKYNDELYLSLKTEKLINLINISKNKKYNNLSKFFYKFKYKSIYLQKEIENKNNHIKNKLLHIIKNKERNLKSNLRKYFYMFYYKGIIADKEHSKSKNIIEINKDNYEKIKKLLCLMIIKKNKDKINILREYFIKWHLFTKVLALKSLINDKRRKKRQKQKLKKKSVNKDNNKYQTKDKILHFGKSNIYILNKDKEKDLLISLDEPNKNYLSSQDKINDDNKLDKIIQATNKLGNLFSKAAEKYKILENKTNPNNKIKENNKDNLNENIINQNNNDIEEEDEDSGDSFGI